MKKSKLSIKLDTEIKEEGFFKKIKNIKSERKDDYKKYARREMEGYFVENKEKKEKNSKKEKHNITREEIEASVKEFLDNGGIIKYMGYLEKHREKNNFVINQGDNDEQDSDFIHYSKNGFQIEGM